MGMMHKSVIMIVAGLIAAAAASTTHADPWTWDGKVRAGGIWLDQTGDESTMPETYDIYDGFNLSSFNIKGRSGALTRLTFDLSDFNQDNRRGLLDFRRAGFLHFRSRYTESRWVFDRMGDVDAGRTNWYNRLSWAPRKTLRFYADYNLQSRDGNRISLNPGNEGWLGTEYDSKFHRYRVEGQVNIKNGIGGMIAYDGVKQNEKLDPDRERDGYVLSANVHIPGYYVKTLTHVLQAAIGRNELRKSGLGFDMMNFQYTGVWQAKEWMRWRYRFYGSQVEDEATTIQTNNFHHDIDGTFSYDVAVLMLGYGWEALDGDLVMSTTNKFRGSLSLHDRNNIVSGKVSFDGSNRDDEENTALLRDSESRRWDARVDAKPFRALAVGVRASDREREYPDISVESEGKTGTAYAAWRAPIEFARIPASITEIGVEYTYADDEYENLRGRQHIVSNAVTGRVGLTVMDDLDLMGSFTYLDMCKDLDLEKSMVSIGAAYRLQNGWSADIKYNVYNYDDFLLVDRYYTANVIWFNVGYEFSTK